MIKGGLAAVNALWRRFAQLNMFRRMRNGPASQHEVRLQSDRRRSKVYERLECGERGSHLA